MAITSEQVEETEARIAVRVERFGMQLLQGCHRPARSIASAQGPALEERPARSLISFVVEVVPLRAAYRAHKRLVGHAFPGRSEATDIAKAYQPGVPLRASLVLNDPSALRA